MFCTIIGMAIAAACHVAPGDRPAPSVGAAILRPNQTRIVLPWRPQAPSMARVTILRTSPVDGPFGTFAPVTPARRLDGSLLSDPPAFYGPQWPVYIPGTYGVGGGRYIYRRGR